MAFKMKNNSYIWILIFLLGYSCKSKKEMLNSTRITEGKYYIDVNRNKYSSAKHFNTDIRIQGNILNIYFLSREGDSGVWNKGDVWATGDINNKTEAGYPISVWESRGLEKELTEGYLFKPIKSGYTIEYVNTKKSNITYYTSTPNEYKIPIDSLSLVQKPENVILYAQQVNNLIRDRNIDSEDALISHFELFQSANEIKFPIDEIPVKRELLSRIGFSIGNELVENQEWSWHYVKWHRNDYVGWIVASPNKEIGLAVEQYFFQADFYKKRIDFENFIRLSKENYTKTAKELTLYEPWMNYDEY